LQPECFFYGAGLDRLDAQRQLQTPRILDVLLSGSRPIDIPSGFELVLHVVLALSFRSSGVVLFKRSVARSSRIVLAHGETSCTEGNSPLIWRFPHDLDYTAVNLRCQFDAMAMLPRLAARVFLYGAGLDGLDAQRQLQTPRIPDVLLSGSRPIAIPSGFELVLYVVLALFFRSSGVCPFRRSVARSSRIVLAHGENFLRNS